MNCTKGHAYLSKSQARGEPYGELPAALELKPPEGIYSGGGAVVGFERKQMKSLSVKPVSTNKMSHNLMAGKDMMKDSIYRKACCKA